MLPSEHDQKSTPQRARFRRTCWASPASAASQVEATVRRHGPSANSWPRMSACSHPIPATNAQNLSSDPPRLLRGQKDRCISNVLWSPDSAKRVAGRNIAFELGGHPAGLDRTGRNRIHGDSVGTELNGSRAGDALSRMLARTVRDVRRMTVGPVCRDVDNAAPRAVTLNAAPCKLGHHQRDRATVDGEVRVMPLGT